MVVALRTTAKCWLKIQEETGHLGKTSLRKCKKNCTQGHLNPPTLKVTSGEQAIWKVNCMVMVILHTLLSKIIFK